MSLLATLMFDSTISITAENQGNYLYCPAFFAVFYLRDDQNLMAYLESQAEDPKSPSHLLLDTLHKLAQENATKPSCSPQEFIGQSISNKNLAEEIYKFIIKTVPIFTYRH